MLAAQELAMDSDGQWLFRQGDLVLGPITASQVVEKLYTGELTPDSQVAPAGEREFRNLRDTATFQVHIARFEAQGRVAQTMLVEQARNQKRVKLLAGIAAGVALLLGVTGWYLARNAAVYGLFGATEEGDGITMDPPTIRLAQARGDDEDLFAYPSNDPRRPDRPAGQGTATGKPAGSGAVASAAVAGNRPPPRTGSVSTDPDGLEMAQQFDQGAINRVVAGNQSKLFRCFKEEAERTPGLAAKIPMEFVIGNDGRVNKLWVDNPQFKQGPLFECLFAELKKWPFKAYDGERATVGLSFNIGKRG
ncbi:AgmX/PglI C-terminal domain-containing protein [Corallococcus exiguus]|uniref:AgmX/PglI C-terminal domain-containing protein n=1 Tax=Corallococcus exiguus TaxID=83462 RepID=UPI001494972D|nr:AgmX/PglI C-terminal domain-containing protein [Corallococcus exiguus]NPC69770.1 AgmX/PglI C-terminal domain-containing protein [Corallococcus exiguus]